ncbi:Uncharacterised protein [Segatella copri]|nr:Uncharacterised protein [Segatella copri]
MMIFSLASFLAISEPLAYMCAIMMHFLPGYFCRASAVSSLRKSLTPCE